MPNPTYQYSNGINLTTVLPALVGRLKWLSGMAIASKSGRYFDDGSFHTMVSESMFKSIQGNADINTTEFTVLQARFEKAAILRVLNAVFDSEQVLESVLLLNNYESKMLPVAANADFVGWAIDINMDCDVLLQIINAVFHFNLNTTLKLYVYEDGCTAPFWEQEVTITGGKYSIANLTGCILSAKERKTQRFYVGYKPSEVTGGSTPYSNLHSEQNETFVFTARPVEGSVPIISNSMIYGSDAKGLNLEIQSFNDFTQRVINSPAVFDEIVGLTHAAMILEQVLFTQRKNSEQRSATDNADRFALQLDLTGTLPISDSPQIIGLRERIAREMNRLKKSFIRSKIGVYTYAPL